VWIAGSLVLSACSSDPDDGTLDLPDEGAAAPEAVEPPVEAIDDPTEPEAEEPLYPPLPALEPDPTSDVPVEDQEFFLDLHARVYEVTYDALTSNEYDLEVLNQYLFSDALETVVNTVQRNQEEATVLRFGDSTIEWVSVVAVEGSRASVQECQLNGPGSGPVDVETGLRAGDRDEAVARVVETTYSLVEVAPDEFEHRATNVVAGEDEERCDVA
jgi:hypothetical protein